MATSPNFNWPEPDNTDLVKNGALAIRTAVDAIDSSLVDLKGGTTGQVLSKASNTDMDFVWAADAGAPTSLGYAAGKNKIINGDFGIWQRGTTFSSSGAYTSDRWQLNFNGSGATRAVSRQTFTAGTAPVAGYEGTYFLRYDQSVAGTGGGYNQVFQPVEDVRTFAGQTVTFSFWAKASATVTLPYLAFEQVFGSGGSGDVGTTLSTTTSLTTSWTRYSFTATVPSISGKTIGTNSYLKVILGVPTNSTFTIDFWGVQLEAGSIATAFQTATGTIQGELAACQRYFQRLVNGANQQFCDLAVFQAVSSTGARGALQFIVPMRTAATMTFSSATHYTFGNSSGGAIGGSSFSYSLASANQARIDATVASGLTAGNATVFSSQNTSATIDASAEL